MLEMLRINKSIVTYYIVTNRFRLRILLFGI
jgi:hypothetical protein